VLGEGNIDSECAEDAEVAIRGMEHGDDSFFT
jgi:hypothetical protein